MKKEKKIIIIGIISTFAALILFCLILFLIFLFQNNHQHKLNNNSHNVGNALNNNNSVFEENNTNDDINDNTSDNRENINVAEEENNTSEKKITLYLFRGANCHFCENALTFFKSIENYPYLEIKAYEVWKNSNNKELMDLVSKKLNIEVSSSVPLIIIGDNYAKRGYVESMNTTIYNSIKEAYESDKYIDVVKEIINSNNLNVTEEMIKESN